MKIRTFLSAALAGILVLLFPVSGRAADDPIAKSLEQANQNHDTVLDSGEVAAGLRRQLGLPPGTSSPDLVKQQALWRQVFGPGPTYLIQELASNPYYNEKLFGLEKAEPKPLDTVHLWVPRDEHPFKLRRTFDDLTESDFAAAKGAEISYSNDFNAHSEQWAFHGIVGYNWGQTKNPDFGATPEGVRRDLDPDLDRGVIERWVIPSAQWDKVDTSHGDTDEEDSLILRLTGGMKIATTDAKNSLFDGFRIDASVSYATDSSTAKGVLAGEFNVKPFQHLWPGLGVGVNSAFKQVGIFRLRPELSFHAEGGTVIDDGGMPELINQKDFLRIGGMVGLSVRFEQISGRFQCLRGLLLHTGLQYYADVTDSGPDVDLFTASADWALDEEGRYTLTAVYRNGRAPLVLERENRLTVGLGVKY